MSSGDVIILGGDAGWNAPPARDLLLEIALGDESIAELIEREITRNRLDTTGYSQLMGLLDQVCKAGISDPDRKRAIRFMNAKKQLEAYLNQSSRSRGTYAAPGKPDPAAVFWPSPSRGRDLATTMPIVEKHPVVDRSTPIGSAGSCFAFRISHELQRKGYNYVVTEEQNNYPNPVFLEEGGQKDGVANFCANWGLLFNSPSFTQLVERAFGERTFKKILLQMPQEHGGYYVDPYREGVGFMSPDAYLDDYEKHLSAVREAFLKCKAFVVTLGLNEYWALIADGTAMSRNPRFFSTQVVTKPCRLTVEENIECIRRFAEIVRAHNPDFQLIVSVSPIPFLATTRGETTHVVNANSHSKAVLRVAAEAIVEADPRAYYFPSYELITTCLPNPWEDDLRHVSEDAVDRVMALFDAAFISDEP